MTFFLKIIISLQRDVLQQTDDAYNIQLYYIFFSITILFRFKNGFSKITVYDDYRRYTNVSMNNMFQIEYYNIVRSVFFVGICTYTRLTIKYKIVDL